MTGRLSSYRFRRRLLWLGLVAVALGSAALVSILFWNTGPLKDEHFSGGSAQVYVMDAEGANLRRLTQSGFNTQPRWSPKGDTIVYTSRQGSHDLWAVAPDGSALRRLTTGPGDNESAAWSPSGRHLAFQSNRLRGSKVFTMLPDGSEQQPIANAPADSASPAWSPRLP